MTVRSLDVNSKSEKNRGDDFTDVWSAIQRTYGTILEAVELLQAHGTSAGSAKTLISELVKILTELLKHLQSIAAQKQVCWAVNSSGIMLIWFSAPKTWTAKEVKISRYRHPDWGAHGFHL